MSKFFSAICLLLTFSGISDATEQPIYAYMIYYNNACAYPVQVTVHHYSTVVLLGETLSKKQNLKAGESASIFEGSTTDDDIQTALSADYKLEINAAGKTISLNKSQFLKVLKKSDFGIIKCGIFCRTYRFSGTINDSSLCP